MVDIYRGPEMCRGKEIPCKTCKGHSGHVRVDPKPCCSCGGAGNQEYEEDGRRVTDACYHCGTAGFCECEPCKDCDGMGYTKEPCGGWWVSDYDTWEKCCLHYKGQPCPDECPDVVVPDKYKNDEFGGFPAWMNVKKKDDDVPF